MVSGFPATSYITSCAGTPDKTSAVYRSDLGSQFGHFPASQEPSDNHEAVPVPVRLDLLGVHAEEDKASTAKRKD